ncbi:hypothetical protein K7I13_12125 [Brucepastera parasyntrophica]|uniref:hypothetical protein n=1 Tax=Brucepastera parasyntrophica TaxID=2880008 RepID=UPI00210A099C|nr:hypothetical protein [Brucepastera parasyntrophica]ULQ59232.1 hypothetical protein K7I13_12125 [Brucepastera parasyntrophica]
MAKEKKTPEDTLPETVTPEGTAAGATKSAGKVKALFKKTYTGKEGCFYSGRTYSIEKTFFDKLKKNGEAELAD